MKTELSAGGVVVRQSEKSWQVLLMKDMNGSWTFPKGLIEPDEEAQRAASREIKEEVGLSDLTLVKTLPSIEYWYHRNGLIHKTVHYFLFRSRSPGQLHIQKEEGIADAQWFSIDHALRVIGYAKTNKKLLVATKRTLSNYGHQKSS